MNIWVLATILGLCLGLGNAQQLQNLKKKLLFQYDKTTKPDGLVTVKVAVRPVNIKLCAHSEVLFSKEQIKFPVVNENATFSRL